MKIILVLCFLCIIHHSFLAAVPLNSTIMLFNEDDLDECDRQLIIAKQFKNQKLHFLASIYADLDSDKKLKRYYLKNKAARVEHARSKNIKRFHKKIIGCVRKALKQTDEVYVTIQLNHIEDASIWRNHYDYDPLEKYYGYSLYDIAYKPFENLRSQEMPKVYLSLTGEMGRSIKLYPQSYSKLIKQLPEKLHVGVSVNFNQAFGGFFDFNLKLPVLNEFDFIGFSSYGMIPNNCKARDFKANVQEFINEIKDYGLTKKAPRIHITEIGLGGGAPLVSIITRMAYKGVYGAYNLATDPWQDPGYRKVRRKYHSCLLDFLKNTDLVSAAFLWNADSWDVQGLYIYSKGYKDEVITAEINAHNQLLP